MSACASPRESFILSCKNVHVGTLAVVRTQALAPKPYTGTVEITSGEVAEDLAVYMAESEQTNSAVALGVQIGPDGLVSAAGGYLIQVLLLLWSCGRILLLVFSRVCNHSVETEPESLTSGLPNTLSSTAACRTRPESQGTALWHARLQ